MYQEYVYIDVGLNSSLFFKDRLIMKFDSVEEGLPCLDCGRFCRQQCAVVIAQVQRELSLALSDFINEKDTPATRTD